MQVVNAKKVRKIAVLRANALGDYIFALPALQSLRQSFPDAELVYLGRSWHRDFLQDRPGPVDRVEVLPRCHGLLQESDCVEDPATVDSFFARMRAERFDIALQMHGGGGNSNTFVRRLGARLSVGLRAAGAPSLDINIPYVLYHNEVLRYLEVAAAAGATPVTVTPQVTVTDADHRTLVSEIETPQKPYVVLHPGATDVRRRWPARKMAQLADKLGADGLTVCITGTPEEADLVATVCSDTRQKALNLCGKLSLPALCALLREAALVVANDTGPLHLARAVGTPTVGLYWMGNVINGGPVSCAGHRYAMSWTTHCPACGMDCIANDAHQPRDGCAHGVSFIDGVSVDAVLEHVRSLLPRIDTAKASRFAVLT